MERPCSCISITVDNFVSFVSAPSGPPLNLSTIITSSRSVTVQWSPPQADLQNGVIQHYTVQLVATQTNSVLQYTATGLSQTISNLHPYYTYTCTVSAVTVASGPAAVVVFQLPQDGMNNLGYIEKMFFPITFSSLLHSSNWYSPECICHSTECHFTVCHMETSTA